MRLRIAGFCGALLGLAGSLAGCESRPAATSAVAPAATVSVDSAAMPVAAAYICPMRCEGSASSKPGKCPVCDMALEAVAATGPTD